MDFTDIKRDDSDNQGGTLPRFYYGFCDEVKTWPTLPSPEAAADLEALGKVTGTIEMETGKRMYEVEIALNSGEAKDEEIGEVGGMSYKHIFDLFITKMNAQLRGFARASLNRKVFLVVPDANGNNVMIGNENFPAMRQAGGGSGTGNNEGRNGAGLSFYSYGPGPAPIIEGVIPLTPAA
ncbi:hypothetical protein DF185_19880 [Marinifilum breve]|uniref:Uncharacterized protein n=1 Tax=Marinifilum breve TaxID=2184082 RepID=A0A2V3ZT77_9BACT|nr:hypothetical protein [Marinifilum breve]PXX96902.1 hypothetical protein DF185_19880 [Marinifilum breve]